MYYASCGVCGPAARIRQERAMQFKLFQPSPFLNVENEPSAGTLLARQADGQLVEAPFQAQNEGSPGKNALLGAHKKRRPQ